MKGQNKHGTTSTTGWNTLTSGSFSNNLSIAPMPQPSMPKPTFSSMATTIEANQHLGVFLNAKATELNYVYRGTTSAPELKFSEGFTAKGNNANLREHVLCWSCDSKYISSSLSKKATKSFVKNHGFIYEINPPVNGVRVENFLIDALMENSISMWNYNKQKAFREISIPDRVSPQDIKGAWEVTLTNVNTKNKKWQRREYSISEEFIPNPEYLPSPTVRFAHVGRALGHAAFAVGAGLDSYNLITADKHNGYFKETTRIIAGWTAALTMGAAPAEACFIIGGSLAGPPGALIGGIGCGALGSLIGYNGASQMVEKGLPNDTDETIIKSLKTMYQKSKSKIVEKESLFKGLRALRQIEEKAQVKQASFGETAIKLGSICALRETLKTRDAQTASQLFLDAAWVDNADLSVTKALANIPGVQCSQKTESMILKITTPIEKANAAAEICSSTRNSQSYRRKY